MVLLNLANAPKPQLEIKRKTSLNQSYELARGKTKQHKSAKLLKSLDLNARKQTKGTDDWTKQVAAVKESVSHRLGAEGDDYSAPYSKLFQG